MEIESEPNSIVFNKEAEAYFNNEGVLTRLHQLLHYLHLDHIEIGINIVSPQEIRILNRDYRAIDESTDILSFALLESFDISFTPARFPHIVQELRAQGETPVLLGDIVLSSAELTIPEGKSSLFEDHTFQLLIHGILHLIGYTHDAEEDRAIMIQLEEKCLSRLLGEEKL